MLVTVFGFLNSFWLPPKGKTALFPDSKPEVLDSIHAPNKISIIYRYESEPSVVLSHLLDDGQANFQVLPGALGYQYIGGSGGSPLLAGDKCLKQLNKGIGSLEKLCQLIGSKVGDNPASPLSIGQGGFVSIPHCDDAKKALDMTDIYTKLQIQFSKGLISTQYFHPRSFTIKQTLLKETTPVHFNRIEINTGICLFSQRVLSTSPGHGKSPDTGDQLAIPPIPTSLRLTLYELETITRMSLAVADVVGLVGNVYKNCDTPIQINIDVPDFQYYWTACELLETRMVTVEYAKSWIEAIDCRKNQLEKIMKSVLRKLLMDRHISGVKIATSSGTEAAANLVKKQLETGSIPSFEEALDALRSKGDDAEMWRLFLDNLDSRQQPSDFASLGRLMYVFKTIKPALANHDISLSEKMNEEIPNRRLIIQVDDIHEWKILDRAKSFIKEYSKRLPNHEPESLMLGLFPIQKIFAAGPGRSDLYLEDPGFNLRLSPEGRIVSPMDVITATYGEHIGNHVRRSCLQVGLS